MDSNGLSADFAETMQRRIDPALVHAWNAFKNKDPIMPLSNLNAYEIGPYGGSLVNSSYMHPDHRRYSAGVDKTLAVAIYNRIVTDCSAVHMHHVRVDENGMFREELKTGLNEILTVEANIDQSSSAFIADTVMSMLDEGYVACVPVDTTYDPDSTNSYDILSMRTGKIKTWYPDRVRLEIYNDRIGKRQEIEMPKKAVAIIENPFYSVMNERNSTLKRLLHKLSLLDSVDESTASGKLDLILQLPYVVKTETKQKQAEKRLDAITRQLEGSKYGIAYTDGTERITQLNRPVENQLMSQIEYLTSILYGQLGISPEIMNGTAGEETMQNYYRRTVDVILNAICKEFERKFLTKTARTQGQAIQYYRDPFSLTPTNLIADIADKFTRNEIMSPNEMRAVVGLKPSDDQAANELRNRNLNQSKQGGITPPAMAPDETGSSK